MAHQLDAEAGDAPVEDLDSAAAAINELNLDELGGEPPEDDEPEQGGSDEGEDEDEQDDEPGDQPAIDPPASLNAEEKARFAQLPEEAQRLIAEVETRRNDQVREATTRAAQKEQAAQATIATASDEALGKYAEHARTFLSSMIPPEVPESLRYTNPEIFDQATRERQQAVQQIDAAWRQIEGTVDQRQRAMLAERDKELLAHPKIADPATRDDYVRGVMTLVDEIGLSSKHVAENATGAEFLAVTKLFDRLSAAEDKAAKYDAAMSKQMQRVREGKTRTTAMRPNAAQSDPARRGLREARERARSSGSLDDAAAAISKLR